MLTFDPLPGNHSAELNAVTISAPEGYSCLFAKGYYPAVVQTIASNTVEGEELPYLQVIDNGLGRVILDGSFPRYYNQRNEEDPNHSRNILFRNMLHYLSGKESGSMLVLGDSLPTDHGGDYSVKSDAPNGFLTTLTNISQWYDFSLTIKDSADFGGVLNPSYNDLVGYDIIFLMSATASNASTRVLTDTAAQYIADLREAGVGILICTNQGNDQGYYYKSANVLLGKLTDAYFEGSYDLTPGTTVGYNKALHGDSPIFKDLDDSTVIQADESISIVVQNALPTPQAFPITVELVDGINDLYLTVITPSGVVEHYRTTYVVGDHDIFQLFDETGEPIANWLPTHLRHRRFNVHYIGEEFASISGNVKVGNVTVGEFTNQSQGPLDVNWLVTNYTLPSLGNLLTAPGIENPQVSVNITEPIDYSAFWDFNRIIYNVEEIVSMAHFLRLYNRGEFETNPPNAAQFFKNAQNLLQNPSLRPGKSLAQYLRHLSNNNAIENYYIDPPLFTGPGPTELVGRNARAGFYGEVPVEELIDGEALADLIGLTDGTAQNSTAPWLKFFIDDRIVYVPKMTYRHTISWDQLDAVDAVFGDRQIAIGENVYKIRLLKGLNPDPEAPFEPATYDTEGAWNSEWNRLMYNISEEHSNPERHKNSQIGENWVSYTQDELNITSGYGRYSWCQETAPNDAARRVNRGEGAVSFLTYATSSITAATLGWRPVLELVQ